MAEATVATRDGLGTRLDRLGALLTERGASALVLRTQASLSWLLGARSHVPQTLDAGCFDVVVDLREGGRPGLTVVTNTIEAPRLRDTELAGVDAAWQVVPWWQSRDTVLPRGPGVIGDRPGADVGDAAAEVAALRRTLTPDQVSSLAQVCRDAAAAASATAPRLTPRTTEYGAAAVLAAELLDRELDPVVLLVAGHERIGPHRHPLPTGRPLGRRAMLVCCARRHGLVASVTRTVVLGGATQADRAAYTRLLHVERGFLDATRPGTPIGAAFAAGVAGYARHGFDPDEWHRHHQGGFSGWQPREYPAHAGSRDVVPESSVVAWNPSGDGWKVEDTCLVTADGPIPLVHDDTWPTVEVGGRRRPDLLDLP